MGIEPTLFAWEARVLPLNDTRAGVQLYDVVLCQKALLHCVVIELEYDSHAYDTQVSLAFYDF